MATKKTNIKVTGSTAQSEIAKPTTNKAAPKAVRNSLTEIERVFDRLMGRGFPNPWRSRDFGLIDSIFDDAFRGFGSTRMPSLDIIDRDNEILVKAEVPGIDKKDIHISLTENLLTIKGETKAEREEDGDYHRREISTSSFARTLTLPGSVDASKASSLLKHGILEITLPKAETSKKRKITVQ